MNFAFPFDRVLNLSSLLKLAYLARLLLTQSDSDGADVKGYGLCGLIGNCLLWPEQRHSG